MRFLGYGGGVNDSRVGNQKEKVERGNSAHSVKVEA